MDMAVVDALARAAKALDAASASFGLNRGEYGALDDMMSMWLMAEAESARAAIDKARPRPRES